MSFSDRSIDEFLADVAEGTATPGGGAAAAVVGAHGAALCEMVCSLAIGDDDYADVEPALVDAREELADRRERLLDLADADSAAVRALFKASAGDTAGSVQDASTHATRVPLEAAAACQDVLELATVATEHGYREAVVDAGSGAIIANGALRALLFTVRANLDWIEDPAFVESTADRATDIEARADDAMQRVDANLAGADVPSSRG